MTDPETPTAEKTEPPGPTPEQLEKMRMPPGPQPIIQLEEVDALKLENSALRLAMASDAVERAKRAYAEEMKMQAQAFIAVGDKYEIDASRYELDPINKVLRLRAPMPVPQPPMAPPEE